MRFLLLLASLGIVATTPPTEFFLETQGGSTDLALANVGHGRMLLSDLVLPTLTATSSRTATRTSTSTRSSVPTMNPSGSSVASVSSMASSLATRTLVLKEVMPLRRKEEVLDLPPKIR